MELTEHLDEVRSRLIRSALALLLFAVVAFMLKEHLIAIIFAPAQPDFILNRLLHTICEFFALPPLTLNEIPVTVINTKMAGQFNLHIKASVFAAFVCSAPYLLYQVWAFVRPALSEDIVRQGTRMMFQVSLLFFVGLAFGYIFISPLAVNFLTNYNFSNSIENLIEVTSYISTVINISLASSLIFQLPHLVFVLARLGLVSSSAMREYRRLALVLIVIVSAVITPPDIFSQLLIAMPFYLLYEWGIRIAQREERRNLTKNIES